MPANVFKYYAAERGLEVLRKLELKITPPDQLNDVFEFSPHFVCSAPGKMARGVLRAKATIRESYQEDRKGDIFPAPSASIVVSGGRGALSCDAPWLTQSSTTCS